MLDLNNEIIENNKLIATFMDYEYINHIDAKARCIEMPGYWKKNIKAYSIKIPNYYLCRKHYELNYNSKR